MDKHTDVASYRDRGWAWVVLVASFVLQMFVDGVVSSFGIVFTELHEKYPNMEKSLLALPGSLMCALFLLTGPLASAVINSFGFRVVGVLGGAITSSALFVVAFVDNFAIFIISFGILGGFGLGLIYMPAVMSTNYYFLKHRAVASGVGMAGAGVGYLIFPLLTSYLVQTYSLKGALLIMSGVCLNSIPFAILLLPIKLSVDPPLVDSTDQSEREESQSIMIACSLPAIANTTVLQHQKSWLSHGNLEKDAKPQQRYLEPLRQKDIFYSSLLPLETTRVETPDLSESNSAADSNSWSKIVKSLALLADLKLLKNKKILIILIGNALFQMGYFVPLVYLVDYTVDIIQEPMEKATTLMVIFGVSHTLGRISGGILLNLRCINSLHLHNLSCLFVGIVNILVPLLRTYPLLSAYCAAHSFFIGIYIPCTPVVLVNFLGIQKLTQSYGIVCFVRGIASFIGPFVGGALLDSTAMYSAVFIWGGTVFTAASVIYFTLICASPQKQEPL